MTTLNGLLTPSESESESEKDQRINDKHQRIFFFSLPLSLGLNEPKTDFIYIYSIFVYDSIHLFLKRDLVLWCCVWLTYLIQIQC